MNNKASKPRRSYSANLYLNADEEMKFREIKDYLHLNKNQVTRIVIDYIYETAILGNTEIDIEDFASQHDVGYGVLIDMFGEERWIR